MKWIKRYIHIEFIYQPSQIQIGANMCIHNHCPEEENESWHFHVWIDLFIWCIELTIGERFQ